VPAVLVHEPDRVEHLHRVVRVEARNDLRDRGEVAIHELAKTAAVVNRSGTRAPGDEELEVRDAERVLDVDGEETDAKRVVDRHAHGVDLGPRLRLAGAILVRDPPDRADAAGVEVGRQRKLTHHRDHDAAHRPSRAARLVALRPTPARRRVGRKSGSWDTLARCSSWRAPLSSLTGRLSCGRRGRHGDRSGALARVGMRKLARVWSGVLGWG